MIKRPKWKHLKGQEKSLSLAINSISFLAQEDKTVQLKSRHQKTLTTTALLSRFSIGSLTQEMGSGTTGAGGYGILKEASTI